MLSQPSRPIRGHSSLQLLFFVGQWPSHRSMYLDRVVLSGKFSSKLPHFLLIYSPQPQQIVLLHLLLLNGIHTSSSWPLVPVRTTTQYTNRQCWEIEKFYSWKRHTQLICYIKRYEKVSSALFARGCAWGAGYLDSCQHNFLAWFCSGIERTTSRKTAMATRQILLTHRGHPWLHLRRDRIPTHRQTRQVLCPPRGLTTVQP